MKPVYLNTKKLKKAIKRGSNSTGRHVLAVNDKGSWRIVWLYNKRTFSPFRDNEVTINIPDTTNEFYWLRMVEVFDWDYWGFDKEEISRTLYNITLLGWLTENFPNYIKDCESMAVDWLLSAFMIALKGDGQWLGLTDPWNGQVVGQKKPQDYFEFNLT